ncbi:MAG TPA: TIGR01777 family oxidoreductase, partial [Jatrophihabitantaceae bacterium]|nr:TIGR01777 family oxidoreductase [Jatrophihabitantaceae bacterium]
GLIGTALSRSLRGDGYQVTTLVRDPATRPDEVQWQPGSAELDPTVLTGADAVVCLSGANVGAKRWTDAYKQTLRTSRIDTVATIARALAAVGDGGPRTFVAASAVGYYGDAGEREIDESAGPGAGFLAQMCVEWEAATQPAEDADVRVTRLRTGIVLDRDADLIRRLRPVFLMGAGGRLGNGRQYLSWISLTDEVRAIRFLLDHDVPGSVNVTAPTPVRNAQFTAAFGAVLHRPAVLRVPGVALRIVLGELAQDALTGQRAIPAKLQAAGFEFRHPDVESALRAALR